MLAVIGVAGAGCLPGLSASSDLESRCQQGLDMVEAGRCAPGKPGLMRVEVLQMELADFKQKCGDGKSVERVRKIETSCVPLYYEKEKAVQSDRRKVRAKYLTEVSALLQDPAYPPLADREKDLDEQASRRPNDRAVAKEHADVTRQLVDLARKHGIDPVHARALELW